MPQQNRSVENSSALLACVLRGQLAAQSVLVPFLALATLVSPAGSCCRYSCVQFEWAQSEAECPSAGGDLSLQFVTCVGGSCKCRAAVHGLPAAHTAQKHSCCLRCCGCPSHSWTGEVGFRVEGDAERRRLSRTSPAHRFTDADYPCVADAMPTIPEPEVLPSAPSPAPAA